ncbi:hypothetical protein RSOLAG1IB_07272 [Rhizoctonia solani AG-1 IB]|uniref:Uncharacterized protein n=1 Tax=Thanatephorus cucumeris (strain AG1-IB / isolate 7/3/14) TaxID=1108050 RepID=A0A0B7FEV8_THACB|nr:hypothetical protein RSOLAG1IB_07272 [Rhizoctonia solani AG-1 IB]
MHTTTGEDDSGQPIHGPFSHELSGSTTSDGGIQLKPNDDWEYRLMENCNRLKECLSEQSDQETIELSIVSLVTQLEEENACASANRSSSLQLLLQLIDY